MNSLFLAVNIQELVDQFGLHTDAFIAHAIAFTLLAAVVVFFGIKPITAQLEERRRRIEEGEAMREESERVLADVQASSQGIIDEAQAKGQEQLQQAKANASRLEEEAAAKAAADARNLMDNAKKQADFDAQQQKEALRQEFARLLASATSQVTGKVLSPSDHEAINAEAIKQL